MAGPAAGLASKDGVKALSDCGCTLAAQQTFCVTKNVAHAAIANLWRKYICAFFSRQVGYQTK
jgi:hypothetical protein